MVLETIPTDEFPDAGSAAPTPEEKATFQTAKAVMKDWFVRNIEDGQVWYDKLDAAVKEAEARVDAVDVPAHDAHASPVVLRGMMRAPPAPAARSVRERI